MIHGNIIDLEYEWQCGRSTLVPRSSADNIIPMTSSVVVIEKTPREGEYLNLIMSTLVTPNIECIGYLPIDLFCSMVSLYVGAKFERIVIPSIVIVSCGIAKTWNYS